MVGGCCELGVENRGRDRKDSNYSFENCVARQKEQGLGKCQRFFACGPIWVDAKLRKGCYIRHKQEWECLKQSLGLAVGAFDYRWKTLETATQPQPSA